MSAKGARHSELSHRLLPGNRQLPQDADFPGENGVFSIGRYSARPVSVERDEIRGLPSNLYGRTAGSNQKVVGSFVIRTFGQASFLECLIELFVEP